MLILTIVQWPGNLHEMKCRLHDIGAENGGLNRLQACPELAPLTALSK